MRVRIIQTVKEADKKKRVCAYARVSTGSEKQGESLENQITYYKKLISDNPNYEYAGIFADRGITGTVDKRPEFQKMMELCREGKIDLIITKSISRFARNTVITLQIARELKNMDVEIRFEKENINTLSGDGELKLAILSSFAQEESKNVSDNLKWRVRKKFQQGELIINTSRFMGYDKNEYGELVINFGEAEIVKRIFSEYLRGKGSFTIAKELNRDEICTIGNKRWHSSTVREILKNEKYKGDAILQKYCILDHLKKKKIRNNGVVDSYYIEDNHSPIISRDVWERVQKEIRIRAEAKGNFKGDKYTRRYPLTGKLYCSKCGAVLRRRTWNSKFSCRKIVWQCSNYIENGKNACRGTVIDDETAVGLNIKEEIVVREEFIDGKKHYSYSCKNKQKQSITEYKAPEKENGSLLQSVYRPIRTVIKL